MRVSKGLASSKALVLSRITRMHGVRLFGLMILISVHYAQAGNLVLNANGGTVSFGSAFSLTGASATNGTVNYNCPLGNAVRRSFPYKTPQGLAPVTYTCTGGSFTYQSSDGTTSIAASFTSGTIYETAYGGGRGGQTKYEYQFFGNLSGVETINSIDASIGGETTLTISGLTMPLGSATAGPTATGINWTYSPFYISDYSFSRIVRVDDLAGDNELSVGSTGSGVNQFYGVAGIALDASGRIYVADLYNARIVRIDDMTGKNWTTFGTYGSGANQFSYATADIAIDSQGRIYVVDTGNGRIDRFDDMNGTNWVTLGTPGSGNNQFYGPSGIALDAAGNIYVADPGNGRIVQMADMNGTNWTTLNNVGSITHLAVDPQNRIVYGDSPPNTVTRVDNMSGANPATLSFGSGVAGINGIQVASDGTTFVATQYGGEIIFDDITTGAGFVSSNLVSQPGGIAVASVPNPVPAVKLSATTLSFASQKVGTASTPQNITLTNFGSAPLDLTMAISQDFQLSTTCPSALPGGSACTISVTYAPSKIGPERGEVTLTDNAFTGTQMILLSGFGASPVAHLSAARVF